jgi:hypothetical protein
MCAVDGIVFASTVARITSARRWSVGNDNPPKTGDPHHQQRLAAWAILLLHPFAKCRPRAGGKDVDLRRQSKFETHADGECRVERSERRCHEVEPVHLLKNTRRQLACRPLELPLQLGADI